MSDPLPTTNRCAKCGEWWAQAHVCPPRQAYAYTGPTPDCKTCRHYVTRNDAGCGSIAVCINANRYTPLPPVKLWRTT